MIDQPSDAPKIEQCERCDGTGLITRTFGGSGDPEWDADDQPCPECDSKGFVYVD